MISQTILLAIGLIGLIGFIGVEVDCSTTREPSIQAYGLPKRFFVDNGYIEHYNNVDEDDEDTPIAPARVNGYPGDPSIVRRQYASEIGIEDGTIEMIHLDSSDSHENVESNPRNRRTVEDSPTSNNEENMQAEESKVFRPLFVYRQQVAKRQRNQRERKNINRDPKFRYNSNNKNSIQYYPY